MRAPLSLLLGGRAQSPAKAVDEARAQLHESATLEMLIREALKRCPKAWS
jgi:hypothetical protein